MLTTLATLLLSAVTLSAQNPRPSPAAKTTETLANGTVVSIDYSQPSLKGRTMGKDVEPMQGKVWRAGANEATVFEVSKDVTVDGKPLPAGKYAFFTIDNGDEWTLIFNKTWKQWGAFSYKEADDALRVKVKPGKTASATEKLTYAIHKSGKVSLAWGNTAIDFQVK